MMKGLKRMSTPTNVARRTANEAGNQARIAANNKWMLLLARLGYAVKGIVYLIIGWLAVELAVGHGGKTTDQSGALQTISSLSYGKFLLILMLVGLIGFALWCFIQAIFDTEAKGKDAKGIIARIGYAAIGVSYIGLALGAFGLINGQGNAGKNTTTSAQDWTGLVLRQPFGQAMVVIGGLIVLAVAGYLFYKAYKAPFKSRLNLTSLGAQARKLVIEMGRFGYGAIGVVMTIVGIFLIVAALQDNAAKVKGLDSALQELSHQSFGPFLLIIVALGLIAYGLYSFVEARYRRIGR